MTHAAATAYYAAPTRHPNKRRLPEAGEGPASTTASATSHEPVAPAPLDLPSGLPRARVRPLLVRMAPGAAPHTRQALEVISPRTQQPMRRAFLLVDQLCKPKDRVRLWLAQVLVHETAQQQQGGDVVWAPQEGYVVVKESDARFIRQYGRLWGEDPIAEMAALARSTGRAHPNVVPALGCFEGTDGCQGLLYLILPHLPGEELFYLVTEAPGRQGLGEAASRPLVRQVAHGLLHLKQAHGLRHGDVSPENVVVSPDGAQATLIDLGMAERVPAGATLLEPRPRRGKKQYMSPEIYEERAYDPWAADVWALGAMLYVCWTGCTVYRNPLDPHYLALRQPGGLARLLREREAKGATRALSPEAKDLLTRMLSWDFRLRPSLEEILAHPWMRADLDSSDSESEEEDEWADDDDAFLTSASTSFSSLGLEEAVMAASSSSLASLSAPTDASTALTGTTSSSLFGGGSEEDDDSMEDGGEEEVSGGSEAAVDERVLGLLMAAAAGAAVLPPKKRGNNKRRHHGESDNSLSSLESLHEQNNGGGSSSSASSSTGFGEGETSDEEEQEDGGAAGSEEGDSMASTPPRSGGGGVPFFE